ncbi:hypothetical protein Godav_025416, partial [Gossypium davidsonii]|nr:hypothetical protein [Gossypium davidsonii]
MEFTWLEVSLKLQKNKQKVKGRENQIEQGKGRKRNEGSLRRVGRTETDYKRKSWWFEASSTDNQLISWKEKPSFKDQFKFGHCYPQVMGTTVTVIVIL